jgi:hypothetical protein
MRLLLALAIGTALVAPVRANADKVYRMYWVSYYPNGTVSLVDKTEYPTFDACQAAEAKYSGGIRWWSNAGYYMCF